MDGHAHLLMASTGLTSASDHGTTLTHTRLVTCADHLKDRQCSRAKMPLNHDSETSPCTSTAPSARTTEQTRHGMSRVMPRNERSSQTVMFASSSS